MSGGYTALILAAGRGERMRPLTARRAKPALPVLGRTMLARIVATLARQGVTTLAANAYHCADSIAVAASTAGTETGSTVSVFVEPQLMGSAGSMAAPAELLGRAPRFLIYNGDTLLAPPVAALFAAAAKENRSGALLVRSGRTPGYGGLTLQGGFVTGHFPRGSEPGPDQGDPATYLGVAVLDRALLERVQRDRPSELFRDVLDPLLAEAGRLATVPYDGQWLEFTSPRSYLKALVRLMHSGRRAGEAALPGGPARLRRASDGVIFAADDAVVESGAIVEGAVVLERGARLRRGARAVNAVLLEGAEVGWGSLLTNVIVDAGVRLPHGLNAHHAVITAGPEGTHVVQPFAD